MGGVQAHIIRLLLFCFALGWFYFVLCFALFCVVLFWFILIFFGLCFVFVFFQQIYSYSLHLYKERGVQMYCFRSLL